MSLDALFESLGYEGEDEFMQQLDEMLTEAEDKHGFNAIIKTLRNLGITNQRMNNALIKEFSGHRYDNSQGQDLSGNCKSKGNMGCGNSP